MRVAQFFKLNEWAVQWLVSINATKNIFMLFTTKRPRPIPPLKLGTVTLHQVFSHKHLGVTVTPNLSWNEHISNIIAKANKHLFIMKAFKYRISRGPLITYYFGLIWPIVEYGDLLFDSCTKALSDKMFKLYTILNHLTPTYLSDTLQSYQTQHRYNTHTVANPVQLKYPAANKEPYRKSFFISSIH